MRTKKSQQQRMKRWSETGGFVAAKAKKGRVLEGEEKAAVLQRLEASKRDTAESARRVANATVRVDRKIEARMTSTPGNKPFAGRSRGMGNALAETDARNSLAATIAERRAQEAERLHQRVAAGREQTAIADAACKRAWDNRLDVRPIIERELKSRSTS